MQDSYLSYSMLMSYEGGFSSLKNILACDKDVPYGGTVRMYSSDSKKYWVLDYKCLCKDTLQYVCFQIIIFTINSKL